MTKYAFNLQTYSLLSILCLTPLYGSNSKDTLPDTYEELSEQQKSVVGELFKENEEIIKKTIDGFQFFCTPFDEKDQNQTKNKLNTEYFYENCLKEISKYQFKDGDSYDTLDNTMINFIDNLAKAITKNKNIKLYTPEEAVKAGFMSIGTAKKTYIKWFNRFREIYLSFNVKVASLPTNKQHTKIPQNVDTNNTNADDKYKIGKGLSANKQNKQHTKIPQNVDTNNTNADDKYKIGKGSSANKQNNNYNQAKIWKIGGVVIACIGFGLILYRITSNASKKSKKTKKEAKVEISA